MKTETQKHLLELTDKLERSLSISKWCHQNFEHEDGEAATKTGLKELKAIKRIIQNQNKP